MWEQRYLTHSFNSADSNSFYLTYYLMANYTECDIEDFIELTWIEELALEIQLHIIE